MKDEEKKEQNVPTYGFYSILSESDSKYSRELDDAYLRHFDPKNEDTKFTEQDYANLQHNLVLFKQGNREATEYIIKSFHRILHTYAHFITLNRMPYYKTTDGEDKRVCWNSSLYSFVSLFISPAAKKKYKQKGIMFRETGYYVHTLFKKYEYGDIYNTLVLALLNMANKYKIIDDPNDPKYKPNGTFHIYVKKCFHFEAYHFLKDLIKDPLLNANLLTIVDDEDIDYDDDDFVQKTPVPIDESVLLEYNTIIDTIDRQTAIKNSNLLTVKEDNIDLYSNDSLNFNWINGVVCGPIFKSLSSYERELLVLSYVKNQTEETLASLYGCSRSTIGSHKRKAIEKLKNAMENNNGGENKNGEDDG
jgi:RNA polymerase sigma factor (sigma-70 family)